MKAIGTLFIGILISFSAIAGEGLPLPWPFPWAKECPVEWQSLEGKYALADSSKNEQLQISFHNLTKTKGGLKLARIARLGKDGELIAEGFNVFTENQRSLRLSLYPLDQAEAIQAVVIKLFYQSSSFACTKQNLVPIMSVEKRGSSTTGTTSYRLVKDEDEQ